MFLSWATASFTCQHPAALNGPAEAHCVGTPVFMRPQHSKGLYVTSTCLLSLSSVTLKKDWQND